MTTRDIATRLRERVWDASIPLEIRLHKADSTSYDSEAYLVCCFTILARPSLTSGYSFMFLDFPISHFCFPRCTPSSMET